MVGRRQLLRAPGPSAHCKHASMGTVCVCTSPAVTAGPEAALNSSCQALDAAGCCTQTNGSSAFSWVQYGLGVSCLHAGRRRQSLPGSRAFRACQCMLHMPLQQPSVG